MVPLKQAWWIMERDKMDLWKHSGQDVSYLRFLDSFLVDGPDITTIEGEQRVSWGQPAGTPRSLIERKLLEYERQQRARRW